MPRQRKLSREEAQMPRKGEPGWVSRADYSRDWRNRPQVRLPRLMARREAAVQRVVELNREVEEAINATERMVVDASTTLREDQALLNGLSSPKGRL